VRVALPPRADLVPGTTAEVLLERSPRGALSVPLTAVLNPGGERPQVFVVRDGSAHAVAVVVASLVGERVTVEGGLTVGDRVVVAGVSRLVDGDAVEAKAQAAAATEAAR
jgi:multidrug efflux pump subunit AcrA (membrane-fusion protein)